MFKLSPSKDASHQVVFDINVVIHGCSNIPHPDAQVYCKWKLTSAGFVQCGVTETSGVLSAHNVVWDAPVSITKCPVKLEPLTKTLKTCTLRFSIRQFTPATARSYSHLGVVTIDLTEYLGGNKITRPYLLENSRFNSAISVTLQTEQVRGDVMFRRKSSSLTSPENIVSECAQLRQKGSPPKLAGQQSALVEGIVRELGVSQVYPPMLQQKAQSFDATRSSNYSSIGVKDASEIKKDS